VTNGICFVIGPLGREGSETRRRSDEVLRQIIRPVARECGYVPLRADELADPGFITSQVLLHILDDALVIADLSERNPNVFYELAVRHAVQKPIVQIIAKGEPLPFDIAGMRTIEIDHRDARSCADARAQITRHIQAMPTERDEIVTPISLAAYFDQLKQGPKSDEQASRVLLTLNDEIGMRLARFEDHETRLQAMMEHAIGLQNTYRDVILDATDSMNRLFVDGLQQGIKEAFLSLSSKPDALRNEITNLIERELQTMMKQFSDHLERMLQGAAIRIDNRIEKMARDAARQASRASKSGPERNPGGDSGARDE
jgi:hypothetical protein